MLTPIPAEDVRLSIAVQHHPARDYLPARIRADLEPARPWNGKLQAFGAWSAVEVVADPEPYDAPNPWRTARACWAGAPDWCTHRLVLQDDVMVCDDFIWAAIEAIRHRPDAIVSFFLGWFPVENAQPTLSAAARCAAWVGLATTSWIPHLAVAMPKELSADLGAFVDYPPPGIADDEVLGHYVRARSLPVWQTIPSLVQHDDEQPSTMAGHRIDGRRRHAACFIGDAHPSLIDWTAE